VNECKPLIPGVTSSTPRIRFLDCTVYILNDVSVGRAGVLVEKMLDNTRYKKWNSNNGWKDGMRAGEHLAVGPGRHCSPRHQSQSTLFWWGEATEMGRGAVWSRSLSQ